jgi:hypothetical protein
MDIGARNINPTYIWVNPPEISIPLTRSPVRFAVGAPTGASTNSWKVWVHKDDIYVACRDNFSGIKVSLHASGIWRVGFTQEFAQARSDIVPEGQDRIMKKWKPKLDGAQQVIIGFQIIAPIGSLYLGAKDRKKWPSSVVFIEPPSDIGKAVVISVAVVFSLQPVIGQPGMEGGVIAVLRVRNDRSVQLVATFEDVKDTLGLIENTWKNVIQNPNKIASFPDSGIFCVHGNHGEDVPWFCAVPFCSISNIEHS